MVALAVTEELLTVQIVQVLCYLSDFCVHHIKFVINFIGQVNGSHNQYYQGSSSKVNEKPPQLPPREGSAIYSQNLPTVR